MPLERSSENELKTIENEYNTVKTRLACLTSLNENYEGYQVGVRTIMKANDLSAKNEGRVFRSCCGCYNGLIQDMNRQ
jgi:hypothetical protein